MLQKDDPLIPRLQATAGLWLKFAEHLAPPKRIHPVDWVQRHVSLPKTVSPLPGRVRIFPYQRGVFEAFADPTIREIILPWGTQLGKSALWQWLIPYLADTNPVPTMVCGPNRESIKRVSKIRIYPILRACHATKRLLPALHDQDTFLINLLSMYVQFAWSGSASTLGAESIYFLIITELDKWTYDKSREGDPEDLAMNRVKAYPHHKVIKESTPTREDSSRIWKNWLRSDQRKYWVPCPHCKQFQTLVMGSASLGKPGLKWRKPKKSGHSDPNLARKTAYYECAHCQGKILDQHKPGMLERGRWLKKGQKISKSGRITGKGNVSHRAGFHLSSLYSPTVTFGEMAALFIEKKNDGIQALQDFVNSWLAEPWRDMREAPEWQKVKSRLSTPRKRRIVPADAVFLTAGADVQENRVLYAIWAWAAHRSAHLVDNGEAREISELNDLVLNITWPSENPNIEPLSVRVLGIDSRYNASSVYDFCIIAGARVLPIKGFANLRASYTFTKTQGTPGGKPAPGLQTCNINVNEYKQAVYHALRNLHAGDPGALNLPANVSEDFLRQLCGESRQKRYDKYNRPVHEWVVIDKAIGNHYLDCTVYAYCMADLCGLRTLHLRKGPDPGRPGPSQTTKKPDWIGNNKKKSWL